ncbi:MAG: hypothetical protein IK123_04365 [Lachnospiraceae bacterium]|nr:hypothetical protein [Lachnospiraceae bacterium]
MSLKINYNVSAMIANNSLKLNDNKLTTSLGRLSSGYKINSAKDDAAGLAISRRMNAQLKGLRAASQDAKDGVSVVEIADGALSEVHDILQRMNELAIKSANGTLSDDDRSAIQQEISQLGEEIDRIGQTTEYNSQKLFTGEFDLKGYTNQLEIKVDKYSDAMMYGEYSFAIETADIVFEEDENGNVGIKKFNGQEENNVTVRRPDGKDEVYKISGDMHHLTFKGDNGDEFTLDVASYLNKGLGTFADDLDRYVETHEPPLTTPGTETPTTIDSEHRELETVDVYEDAATGVKKTVTTTEKQELDEDGTTWKSVSRTISTKYEYTDSTSGKKMEKTIKEERVWVEEKEKAYLVSKAYWKTESKKVDSAEYEDPTNHLKKEINSEGISTYTYTPDTQMDLELDLTGYGAMTFQVGANESQTLDIRFEKLSMETLGFKYQDSDQTKDMCLNVGTANGALKAIDQITAAIGQVSAMRSRLGAMQNRLEHTDANLATSDENMTAAYSRIMDTDMAEEMSNYSNLQIVSQAATAILAQANERPSQMLQLLQ